MSIHSLKKCPDFIEDREYTSSMKRHPQTVGDDLLCFIAGLTQIPGDQIVSGNLLNVPF
jgi:hypothetical protein